ncbi:hypothetical protein H0H81_008987 [Sphagnurus paluster]|uniref:Amidohydrolase 3 domain-containing protein n=1 Tax=Sphagnurus paluster TaxID=117069 RepID=A0A9P7FSD6_9AGAR|nr:hypothetical protein H0H81_008987 [Sphagnurus paluster]
MSALLKKRSKEKVEVATAATQPSTTILPSSSFSPRLVLTLFGIALLSAATLYNRSTQPAYALCTPGTRKTIYTVDASNSQVQCLVVRGARIVDTGDLEDVKSRWDGPELNVKYLNEGEVVVPGMSDSHCHILEYGASQLVSLQDGKSVQGMPHLPNREYLFAIETNLNLTETVQILADYINADPILSKDLTKVVEGWGYDHASWDIPVLPTAVGVSHELADLADLEANPTTRGRQIMLSGRDGHSLWVSAATLAANKPYPKEIEGGVIMSDKEGNPTGVFLDTAMDLIKRPTLTHSDRKARFKTTVAHALRSGLTTLHDAGFKPESFDFFSMDDSREAERAPLPLRIYGMRYFDIDENAEYWGNKTKPLTARFRGDEPGTRLSSRSVKIFADGGAALYEPYADNPSTSGLMRISPETLHRVVPDFLRDGWQVNIHAIGDRANGIVLDSFELAGRKLGVDIRALRPRIEHVQIIAEKDMHRLGELGIIASIQPTHATSDMWYGQDRLGPERVKGLYAFRNLMSGGARITLGSDFPVEEVNPLAGFFAAITRVAKEGTSPHGPGGWFPEQKLTRLEALRGAFY